MCTVSRCGKVSGLNVSPIGLDGQSIIHNCTLTTHSLAIKWKAKCEMKNEEKDSKMLRNNLARPCEARPAPTPGCVASTTCDWAWNMKWLYQCWLLPCYSRPFFRSVEYIDTYVRPGTCTIYNEWKAPPSPATVAQFLFIFFAGIPCSLLGRRCMQIRGTYEEPLLLLEI